MCPRKKKKGSLAVRSQERERGRKVEKATALHPRIVFGGWREKGGKKKGGKKKKKKKEKREGTVNVSPAPPSDSYRGSTLKKGKKRENDVSEFRFLVRNVRKGGGAHRGLFRNGRKGGGKKKENGSSDSYRTKEKGGKAAEIHSCLGLYLEKGKRERGGGGGKKKQPKDYL